jgi:hypothetical protein
MARLFTAYAMVDWSASSKPSTGEDSIWIGLMKRDVRFRPVFSAHNPPTRRAAEDFLLQAVEDLRRKGERTLIGFDFPLGYPRGAASALKLKGEPPWRALHAFLSKEVKDKPDNANNRFQVAAMMNRTITGGPFPFWGCPPRDALTTLSAKRARTHGEGDLPEFRHTDQAAKGAQSVWKLYTAGNVGSQALVGIPTVARLKEAWGDTARIWPFETGWRLLSPPDLSGVDVVMTEIYPSLLTVKPQPGELKDAAQVRTAAEHFSALDEKGKLGVMFGPTKERAELAEAVEAEEGWILGA